MQPDMGQHKTPFADRHHHNEDYSIRIVLKGGLAAACSSAVARMECC